MHKRQRYEDFRDKERLDIEAGKAVEAEGNRDHAGTRTFQLVAASTRTTLLDIPVQLPLRSITHPSSHALGHNRLHSERPLGLEIGGVSPAQSRVAFWVGVIVKEGFVEEFDPIVVGGRPAGSTVERFLTLIAKPATFDEEFRDAAGGNNAPGLVKELLSAGDLVGTCK
jgi:hypothetical protein